MPRAGNDCALGCWVARFAPTASPQAQAAERADALREDQQNRDIGAGSIQSGPDALDARTEHLTGPDAANQFCRN